MRIVCVYTKQQRKSVQIAQRCVGSGKQHGYKVELYPAVYWREMSQVHEKLGLRQKYEPVTKTSTHTATTCPAARMANGTTHFMLYEWCIQANEPVCILEHDSYFVGRLPEPKVNGVIQVSSHRLGQCSENQWQGCRRAQKMRKYQPEFKFIWPKGKGVQRHPLTGLNGTSGYIIHPGAAKKMVDYIREDGIANADRVRTEWIGEGNLYLQIPQSINCDHQVRSTALK